MAMVMFWSHTFPSPLLPCTPCATPGGLCGLGTPQPSCSTEGQQSSMEATAGGKCHHTLSPCLSGDPAPQRGCGCSLSQHSTEQPSARPVTRTWLTPCAMMQTCAAAPASQGGPASCPHLGCKSSHPTAGTHGQVPVPLRGHHTLSPSHRKHTRAGPCPPPPGTPQGWVSSVWGPASVPRGLMGLQQPPRDQPWPWAQDRGHSPGSTRQCLSPHPQLASWGSCSLHPGEGAGVAPRRAAPRRQQCPAWPWERGELLAPGSQRGLDLASGPAMQRSALPDSSAQPDSFQPDSFQPDSSFQPYSSAHRPREGSPSPVHEHLHAWTGRQEQCAGIPDTLLGHTCFEGLSPGRTEAEDEGTDQG